MKKFYLLLLVLLLAPVLVSAVPSLDPDDYFFFDDFEDGFNASKYTGSQLSVTTSNPFEGLNSLKLDFVNNVACDNQIATTEFVTAEFSTPYCVEAEGLYTANVANNLEQGFLFTNWADAYLFDSNAGASSSNITAINNAGPWTSIGFVPANTYFKAKICFIDGFDSGSLHTTALYFVDDVNIYNTTNFDRLSLNNVCFHNRDAAATDTQFDNLRIWNRSEFGDLGPQAGAIAGERLEQAATVEQTSDVLINSNNFVTVLSGTVTLEQDTIVYVIGSVPIVDPSKDEVATCQVTLDGAEFNNSLTVKDVLTGDNSHMAVFSFGSSLDADNYTFGLECTRQGGLQYTVSGSNIIIHELITNTGVPLVYNFSNVSSVAVGSGVLHNFSITTSANETLPGLVRSLVIEWGGNMVFSGAGNISASIELAGVSCTPMVSFGDNLDVNSVGSTCVVQNLTNSTVYDVRLFGNGSGTLEDMVFHVKEFIAHTAEVNFTFLNSGTPLPTGFDLKSLTLVASANVTIDVSPSHSDSNIVTISGISVYTDNGSSNASFMLSVNNINSSIIDINVFENEPTMLLIQDIFPNATGNNTVFLFGACANTNCIVEGVDLVAYLTDAEDIVEQGFDITLQNSYDNFSVVGFNVRDDDGNIFSTLTSTLRIFTNQSLFNITHPGNNNTAAKFFENVTLNHNTSGPLGLFSRAWTAVNAVNIENFSISIFSVFFSDSVSSGSDSTVNGVAFVPFSNSTYNLSIFDATDSNGINYANASVTGIGVINFLQNFTFNLAFTNSINISFFETFSLDPILSNVTVLFVGPGPSFSNVSNTGNMFISNLTVGTWTLQASADGFDSSTYFVTVSDRSTQSLSIFMLNSTLSGETTFTIKDRTTGDVIPGASFDMFQLVNGSSVSIGQQISDAFGVVFYGLVQGDNYEFIVEAPDFDTRIGNFTRTTSSYVVSLSREIGENFDNYLNSFSYFIAPKAGTALSNETFNFSLTVSSPLGQMEFFTIDFSNNNLSNGTPVTVIDNVTSSPSGGIAIVELDLGNFTGTLIGTFTMKSVLFAQPLIVGRTWFVINGSFAEGNFTFTDFMVFYGPQDEVVDDRLSLMSRVLLLTIAAVILGLSLAIFFGSGGAVLGVSLVYLGGSFYGWLHWSITIVVVTVLLGQFFIRGGRI